MQAHEQTPCRNCGKLFLARRGKNFCSEKCRKRDENKRLRGYADAAVDNDATRAEPVRGASMGKEAPRPLRGDQISLCEPLTELAEGFKRIAAMLNPTIEAIQFELAGWRIEDERTIQIMAWRMRVAVSAVREALR